jgi:hypothetical protein
MRTANTAVIVGTVGLLGWTLPTPINGCGPVADNSDRDSSADATSADATSGTRPTADAGVIGAGAVLSNPGKIPSGASECDAGENGCCIHQDASPDCAGCFFNDDFQFQCKETADCPGVADSGPLGICCLEAKEAVCELFCPAPRVQLCGLTSNARKAKLAPREPAVPKTLYSGFVGHHRTAGSEPGGSRVSAPGSTDSRSAAPARARSPPAGSTEGRRDPTLMQEQDPIQNQGLIPLRKRERDTTPDPGSGP